MAHARWQEIAQALQDFIRKGRYRPGDRLPTAAQLADEWGVAQMTAHRALHELQRAGWVVRQRRHGTIVAPVQSRHSGMVALLINYTDDFPQADLLRGIRDALPGECHLIFCDTRANPTLEAEYLRRMEQEVDGIICWPTCAPENTPLLQQIAERGVPLVCIDRVPANLVADAVVADNYGSSLEALRALVARGHSRIAHLTDQDMQVSSIRERYAAYLQAMEEIGQTNPQTWVRRFPVEITHDLDLLTQLVHDALFTLLHQSDPPTALFLLHDYFLTATLEVCDRMGIQIGEDLEILSFNVFPQVSLRVSRSIHRITLRAYEMGQIAAERLNRRMHGETMSVETIRVPAQIAMAEGLRQIAPAQFEA